LKRPLQPRLPDFDIQDGTRIPAFTGPITVSTNETVKAIA